MTPPAITRPVSELVHAYLFGLIPERALVALPHPERAAAAAVLEVRAHQDRTMAIRTAWFTTAYAVAIIVAWSPMTTRAGASWAIVALALLATLLGSAAWLMTRSRKQTRLSSRLRSRGRR